MDAGAKEFAQQLFGQLPDAELAGFITILGGVIERLREVVAGSMRKM
ncbi:MAG: hypothetical protein ACRDFX_14340 [Chloroflexota bacterium]